MGEGVTAPVIVGLAVGITFVIMFSSFAHLLPIRNDSAFIVDIPDETIITIPEGASNEESGKTFEPQTITVVIGVNNTVRWVNQDTVSYFIEADNDLYDPAFYQLTDMSSYSDNRDNNNVLMPNDYFEYTFTKPGEYGYHSKPWMQGTVIVLEEEDK